MYLAMAYWAARIKSLRNRQAQHCFPEDAMRLDLSPLYHSTADFDNQATTYNASVVPGTVLDPFAGAGIRSRWAMVPIGRPRSTTQLCASASSIAL
jgi:hypothetical protein